MNKFYFYIFSILIFVNIFSSYEHITIPPQEEELIKGLLEGSGLTTYLNLTSCDKEVYEFLIESLNIVDSLIKNNSGFNADVFKSLGDAFILYSQLTNTCIGTKERLGYIINYANSAFLNPQKFLIGALDNTVSFHVVKLYWGLPIKIKAGELYEGGKILGEIFAYIVNVNLDSDELSFLSGIYEKESHLLERYKKSFFDVVKDAIANTSKNILSEEEDVNFIKKKISEYISNLVTRSI